MKMNSVTSVDAIKAELGARLKRARLNKDLSQDEVATIGGLSRHLVGQLEKGEGTLVTLIAFLKALDMVEHLDSFIPPVPLSPIELAKREGNARKRASGTSRHDKHNWGGSDW